MMMAYGVEGPGENPGRRMPRTGGMEVIFREKARFRDNYPVDTPSPSGTFRAPFSTEESVKIS